ncbi:MAG: hypothetical protein H7837_07480 [Magnetococcus sp. MYC-9]
MRTYWYHRLTLRERLLLLLTVAASLLAGWHRLVWLPFALQWSGVESRLAEQTRNQERAATEQQPLPPWLERARQWVPPGEVEGVLDRLTRTRSGLRMVGMELRPPRPLLSCEQGLSAEGAATLFRHELTLTLEGGYPAFLTYLHRLEELPWKIHVDHLNYQVGHSSQATLQLQLHFFSLRRSLFVD